LTTTEFDKTKFSQDTKIKVSNVEYWIFSIDFENRIIGLSTTQDDRHLFSEVECVHCDIVYR
jgi:hypothetical protein